MLKKLRERALRSFCVPQECAHTEEMVKAEQKKYLKTVRISDEQECAWAAWVAANTQGAGWPVFARGTKESDKEKVRVRACQELDKFAKRYKKRKVSEDEHTNNIQALRDTLTQHHWQFLHKREYRFGRAQKMLNVYLKYLWCLEKMGTRTPPHCTFDRDIIKLSRKALGSELGSLVPKKMIRDKVTWNWTQSDDVNHYLLWVAGAKAAAKKGGHRSPAEWELIEWNKRQGKKK